MVPAVFAELAALPLTPEREGRPGRAAGAGRGPPGAGRVRAAVRGGRGAAGRVWAQVLGVDRVGAGDNFFELGGDSIISIQVVARARAAGLHVSAAELFEHQTVAALAAAAAPAEAVTAEQGAVSGGYPLTPVQRWFLGRGLPAPGHFNQSVLLEVAGRVEVPALRAAAAALLAHHDALRAVFRERDGAWEAAVSARPAEAAGVVEVADAGDLDGPAEARFLEAAASAAQAGLDLGRGPLLRLLLCERGGRGQLLVMIAHHLAVDAVSWPVLVEDLAAAYGQAEAGRSALPPKTTSFPAWARRLAELAGSAEVAAEAGYWRQVAARAVPLPRDLGGANTLGSAASVQASLGAGQTERLLHDVPAAYRTQINDVLLTALGIALTSWAGAAAVVVDLEGHGRHEDVGGRASTCPGRSAGSPRCTRSRWAARRAGTWARRCARSRRACGRCPATAWATGCCGTWPGPCPAPAGRARSSTTSARRPGPRPRPAAPRRGSARRAGSLGAERSDQGDRPT